MTHLVSQKERGAFFTPQPIAQFLSDWAIRTPGDAVIEPSCGEAVFLEAAGRRLDIISQANDRTRLNLRGIEIHQPSALRATDRLVNLGYRAQIECSDFFDATPDPIYDAVLGNPPFIRYQSFSGDSRAKALKAALRQGVPLRKLSSAWAAFLVHASAFVKPNGRLGFVLPAELLATHYAAEVRSFLLRRFGSLKIILFEQLIFPGVMEEVILLLAEGAGGCKSFEVIQVKNAECLNRAILRGNGYEPPHPNHKWTTGLLHQEAQDVLSLLAQSKSFEPLSNWGNIYLGTVTGNNDFFILNETEKSALKLSERDVLKICPPGTRKLGCLAFEMSTWQMLREQGMGVYLFYPHSTKLNKRARSYVERGRRQKIQTGYKCSNREIWWRVPIVEEPDLIFTYMNHQMPRLISNDARVQVTNSVYGVSLVRNRKKIGKATLPILFFNSISALSSEVEGRSYGGGLLKHEPREADHILMPSLSLVADLADEAAKMKQTYAKSHHSEHAGICGIADELMLNSAAGLSREAIKIVQTARNDLLNRRMSRSRSGAGAKKA
jgi:adenine-specific DNA-methyltransferase